ncbi:hypothetical protein D3I60_01705 [Brevibacterium permense]|uniref:hypothetical protein n=1 Tax=Brevibacterium permense TaxID=234834 RepID=UPI0021D39715|nr:hypothetical protein [Brevibacterium permense]MCU4295807.1 hypothetical protein [Brevibacterium permense]
MSVNPRPSAKTTTTGAAGAATLLIVWGAGQLGVDVPGDVAAAAVLLTTVAVSWFMPADSKAKH